MIDGAHVVLYSSDADADRSFLRDVLGFAHVDAGHGWLIFALPAAEAAVHPADGPPSHELFLMCDDLDTSMAELATHAVEFDPIDEARWGRVTRFGLPSGGRIGLYEPRHPRPWAAGQPARP